MLEHRSLPRLNLLYVCAYIEPRSLQRNSKLSEVMQRNVACLQYTPLSWVSGGTLWQPEVCGACVCGGVWVCFFF